jgi:hypothetical protein
LIPTTPSPIEATPLGDAGTPGYIGRAETLKAATPENAMMAARPAAIFLLNLIAIIPPLRKN